MAAHHGSTPAAWAAVTLVLIAFLVGAVGVLMSNWLIFWVGVAFLLPALVVGKVLERMGLDTR